MARLLLQPLLAIALLSQGFSQSLGEAVLLMLEYEPELIAADRDTRSAAMDARIARADLKPHLALEGSGGFSRRDRSVDGLVSDTGDPLFSREIGLTLRQLLFDGGMTSSQSKAAEYSYEAQQLIEMGQIEARVVDLTEVYLEVIRTGSQLDLAEENVENHRKMRDMLEERARNGGSRADAALVQGRLGLAINALQTQRLARNKAIARFKRLVGQPPSVLGYPHIPELPGSLESVDLSSNWDRLAAEVSVLAAEEKYKMMRGNLSPKLYLDLGGSVGEDVLGVEGSDNEARAFIVGSWDLYRGGAKKALRDREALQVEKFEQLLRAATIQTDYHADILWQEREGSRVSIQSLGIYAGELKQVTSDYQEQFKVGRQELLNILDVQSEAYSAQSRLIDARFDADMGTYRLMGVQGRLTSFLVGEGNLPTRPPIETPADLAAEQAKNSFGGAWGPTGGADIPPANADNSLSPSPLPIGAKTEKVGLFKRLFHK